VITSQQLAHLCDQPDLWADPINAAMLAHWINTPARESMFLATCLHESDGFKRLTENLNYSASGLLRVWPDRFTHNERQLYAGKPQEIANRAYAHRNGNGSEDSGDGWRYRGRGLIQLTGKNNYVRAQAATGFELVANPELLEEPLASSEVAAWFWADAGCNAVADEGDFPGTQGIINRGSRAKLADRMDLRLDWLRKVQAA